MYGWMNKLSLYLSLPLSQIHTGVDGLLEFVIFIFAFYSRFTYRHFNLAHLAISWFIYVIYSYAIYRYRYWNNAVLPILLKHALSYTKCILFALFPVCKTKDILR